jgi:hypothetical protein
VEALEGRLLGAQAAEAGPPIRPRARPSAGSALLAAHPMPAHLLRLPGALQGVVDWYARSAPKPQPLFAVAAALAIGSVALGRNWRTANRNYSSLWLMCVGESGCGKEWLKTSVESVLTAAGYGALVNLGGYTSQGAVFTALAAHPVHLSVYDEAGRYLQVMGGLRQVSHEINAWTTLMEAWGRCDGAMAPPKYSQMALSPKQREQLEEVRVVRPAVSVLAMTTPDSLYEALTPELVKDGFLGRWIVVETEIGLQPGWEIASAESPPEALLEWVRLARTLPLGAGNLVGALEDDPRLAPEPRVVPIAPEAKTLVHEFEEAVLDRRVEVARWGFSEGYGRATETVLKVALILAASEDLRAPVVEARHVAWARDWVWYNAQRLEARARDRLVGGRIAREVVRLKEFLLECAERGATFREIRRRFRGWDAMTLQQALRSLVDGGEVALARLATAGRPREAYVAVDEGAAEASEASPPGLG